MTGEEGNPGRVEGDIPERAEGDNPGRVEGDTPGRAEGDTPGRAEEDTPGRVEGDRGRGQGVHHQTLCLGEEVRTQIIQVSSRSASQYQPGLRAIITRNQQWPIMCSCWEETTP